ncbi:DUF1571 domain-containing protein [Hymenobacter sp. J193]|uniref:DUF1571 domain-containing protein n=1 Tax=Hymenobacter sp. J193 TaxID=2898429 RepID=UPI00215199B8|nr:DUF1571 domain-containing protein [Hymenobacter sp. J193]MCR5889831.1 DUF1571 domain-containing protein [Hymenobacter sp. J193]
MISPLLRFTAGFALLGIALGAAPAEKMTTAVLVSRLSYSIDHLKTLRCTVKAQERIDGTYQQARTQMKIAYSPLRLYLRNQKGVEVLYVAGQNDNEAYVYPNSFPYVTVSLDPNGTLMRRNQHHSVFQAGFGTIADLLHGSAQRTDHSFERSFRYAGDTTVAGRPGYILRSDFPQFRYITYKPAKAETVAQIADKFGCGEYRILERNSLSHGATVPAGKAVQVPNSYGRRTIVCVDQATFLPTLVQVHDDKGLFEKFEFSDVVANQPIAPAEFQKGYKGYKI